MRAKMLGVRPRLWREPVTAAKYDSGESSGKGREHGITR